MGGRSRLCREARGRAPTIGRQALLFQILTAARPGEVSAARWDQIDDAKRDWNRPASIMKAGKAHSVMLSTAVMHVLGDASSARPRKAARSSFLVTVASCSRT